jgi:hypothetical protein
MQAEAGWQRQPGRERQAGRVRLAEMPAHGQAGRSWKAEEGVQSKDKRGRFVRQGGKKKQAEASACLLSCLPASD